MSPSACATVSFEATQHNITKRNGTERRRQHQQQRHQPQYQRQYLQQHTTMKKAPPATKPSSSPAIRTTQHASSNVESDSPAAVDAVAAAEPPPPQDECAICCYLLPFRPNESVYKSCCGNMICLGCVLGQTRVRVIGENVNVPLKGSKEEEREFKMIYFREPTPITGSKEEERSELGSLCPFCNAKNVSENDNERLKKRLWERIDEYNDPAAMLILGIMYRDGKHGVSKNPTKAEELLQSSYDLGDADAAFHLAHMYSSSVPNPEQAREIKYLEEGARRGSVPCLYSLGASANKSGNHAEAIRYWTTAARSGDDPSLQTLLLYIRRTPSVICTGVGMAVFKDDLATTLRAHKAANDERRSVPRDYSKRYKDWVAKWNAQVEN